MLPILPGVLFSVIAGVVVDDLSKRVIVTVTSGIMLMIWFKFVLEYILIAAVCAVEPAFNRTDDVFQYVGDQMTHLVDFSVGDINTKIVSFNWFMFFVTVLHIICTLTVMTVNVYIKGYTSHPNDTPNRVKR